jgi:hypothetical protein
MKRRIANLLRLFWWSPPPVERKHPGNPYAAPPRRPR